MLSKTKIYLDTSVLSHFKQDDVPDRTGQTLKFWEMLKMREDVEIVLSEIVFMEIYGCSEEKIDFITWKLNEHPYTRLNDNNDEIEELVQNYLKHGVLTEKSSNDLRHIACASLYSCDYIISWNFKHFVNPKKISAVNAVNKELGLAGIIIFTPEAMLGGF